VTDGDPRLKRHALDERARAYVRGQLEVENTLCRSLLGVFDRGGGDFYTVAPEGATNEQLHAFTGGGLYPMDWSQAVTCADGSVMVPTPYAYDVRARCLFDIVRSDARGFCVTDDYVGSVGVRAGQPPEDGGLPGTFFLDGETYCLVTAQDDVDTLETALRTGDEIWHGVAAVFLPPQPVTRTSIATPEALAACAEHVREISVTAYDAEGFVAWSRG
jgi:hypothetical protein